MHEHFFIALTLDRLLANPAEATQTCISCIEYASKADRKSAIKAIEMIVKRQIKLRLTAT